MPSPYAAQARQEVRQAYRPAFKALHRQAKRVRAMDRKQQRDDAAYQSWLRDTNASLNAEAAQRDTQLQGVEAGYNQQIQQALQSAQDARATRNAQTGSTGGPDAWGVLGTRSEAYDPTAQALKGYASAQSAAYGGRLAENQRRGLSLSHATEANTYATVAQIRAQHRAATFDALSKIASQRGDLAMKRAADVGKRTADLEAAAAKEAQQRFTNQLALDRLAQGDQRIALAQQVAADRSALSHETSRQGRVRNQLARRRLAMAGKTKKGGVTAGRVAEGQQKLTEAMHKAEVLHPTITKYDSKGKPYKVPVYSPNLKGGTLPHFKDLVNLLTNSGYGAFAGYVAYKRLFPNSPVPLRHIAAIERAYGFRPPR